MSKVIKFFACAIFVLISTGVSSQPGKGSILIGGGSQFSLTSLNTSWKSDPNDSRRTTTLDLSPYFGFFISDRFVLGAMVPLGRVTEKVENTKEITTSAAFGPFLRFYAMQDANVRPYLQGMAGPGHVRMTRSGEKEIISFRILLYEFNAGLAFFVNENVCLDLLLGYTFTMYNKKTNLKPDESDIFYNKGLGVKLGFVFLL